MSKKIIIIDDDKRIRNMFKIALEIQGYDVTEMDAQDFLKFDMKIKQKSDLIILDIMMPKINGLDLLNMLKTDSATKNIKVIMVTALSDEISKKRASDLGAYAYLVKSELSMPSMIEKFKEALTN